MEYRYIFHFTSGKGHIMTTKEPIDLASLTTKSWFFINKGDSLSYCNNGGTAINIDNVESIDVEVEEKD